jgi:hypothetical protein
VKVNTNILLQQNINCMALLRVVSPIVNQTETKWLSKFGVFWGVAPCSHVETSVNFNVTTNHYIPEESKLHTRRRESLKSQEMALI